MRRAILSRRALLAPAVLLLSASAPLAAHAQGSYTGSLYSRYGLGERVGSASAQGAAMGGGGIGLVSLSYVQVGNPATLAEQILTRATAGAYVQGLRAEDGGGRTGDRSEGVLSAVEFAFPVTRQRVGVGLRFTPSTRLAYGVQRAGMDVRTGVPTGDDTLRYTVDYQGSGGLNTVDGGVGVAIGKTLMVGASVGARFGLLETGRRTQFLDRSGTPLLFYAEQNAITITYKKGVAPILSKQKTTNV